MFQLFKKLKSVADGIIDRNGTGSANASAFQNYETKIPSNQNAIDAVPGWSTALPDEYGVVAGTLKTFTDMRMDWTAECYGSLEGKTILELGPLEAGHTMHLERLGATVTGIEANKLAFLRCLVAKEIVGLRAKFKLGDFVKWLEETDETYDLIVASGVLYHMREPLQLLELMSKRSDALYIWTHFVNEDAMPFDDPRRSVIAKHPRLLELNGEPIRIYRRTYANAQASAKFNGGKEDNHSWMHGDDILKALRILGYTDIRIAHETRDHQNGPAFSVFARRS